MTTVNYAWTLPTVGASTNTWGTLLNTILTDIDLKMVTATHIVAERSASRALTNLTGITVVSGGASITGNSSVTGQLTTTDNVGIGRPTNANYRAIIRGIGTTSATNTLVLENSSGTETVIADDAGNVGVGGNLSTAGTITVGTSDATAVVKSGGASTHLTLAAVGASGAVIFNRQGTTESGRFDASGNLNMTAGGHIGRTATASGIFFNTNSVLPSTGTGATDNTVSFGSASYRWTTIYATTGAINTSDARAKTKVRTLADAEIEAAIEHSKEIGIFQWLDAVAKKGEKARQHIGMTVQRSIEIMEKHGLDPMSYAFICHDVWGDEFKEHPAIDAVEAKASVIDGEGNVVEPAVEAVEGKDAWTEQTQFAGDRYAFRYDQLNLFIARGIEARLAVLEARA